MSKQSINLVIRKEADKPFVKKAKLVSSLLGIGSLTLFIILFVISVFYVNSNISQFNQLKNEVEQLEKKIGDQKSNESVFVLTVSLLDILNQILSSSKNFSPLLTEINTFTDVGISIDSVTLKKNSDVSFSVTAPSTSILDDFITRLEEQEEKKLFSEIAAYGITRDKKGRYSLTISLKSSPSLLP